MSPGSDAICTTVAAARHKSLQLQALLWSFWGCIWQLGAKKMAADTGKLQKQLWSAPKQGFVPEISRHVAWDPCEATLENTKNYEIPTPTPAFLTQLSRTTSAYSHRKSAYSHPFSGTYFLRLVKWISPLCFWISPLCFEFLRLVSLEVLLSGILKSILRDMGWKGRLPPFRHYQVLWTPHVHTAFH